MYNKYYLYIERERQRDRERERERVFICIFFKMQLYFNYFKRHKCSKHIMHCVISSKAQTAN